MPDDFDQIWKALADRTRRTILDFLRAGPRPTTDIVDQFPDLSRFAVMKHLDVLRQAALVVTREEGRRRINSLNAAPIRQIYERWVSHFEDHWPQTLMRVKESAETTARARARRNTTKNAKSPTPPVAPTRDEPTRPPKSRRRGGAAGPPLKESRR